ncbi:hypothetical protein Lal_00033588 [Lupinus albus]|nr:hypothetical protein Lal_00033588 [Lupinus albus]
MVKGKIIVLDEDLLLVVGGLSSSGAPLGDCEIEQWENFAAVNVYKSCLRDSISVIRECKILNMLEMIKDKGKRKKNKKFYPGSFACPLANYIQASPSDLGRFASLYLKMFFTHTLPN